MRRLKKQLQQKSTETPAVELDPITASVASLVGYMSVTAGACADAVLDKWPSLAGETAGPPVSYSVYSQFTFLYLHVMDRMAFGISGDEGRLAVREAVGPLLILALNAYLSGRHGSSQRPSGEELELLTNDFFGMLDQSEFSFSEIADFQGMMDEVVDRLIGAWQLTEVATLREITRSEAGIRGHNLQPLLEEVIRQLKPGP